MGSCAQYKNAVSKRPAADQGPQTTKWLAVKLFPVNLEIYEFV